LLLVLLLVYLITLSQLLTFEWEDDYEWENEREVTVTYFKVTSLQLAAGADKVHKKTSAMTWVLFTQKRNRRFRNT
jgi:hypothetical protein